MMMRWGATQAQAAADRSEACAEASPSMCDNLNKQTSVTCPTSLAPRPRCINFQFCQLQPHAAAPIIFTRVLTFALQHPCAPRCINPCTPLMHACAAYVFKPAPPPLPFAPHFKCKPGSARQSCLWRSCVPPLPLSSRQRSRKLSQWQRPRMLLSNLRSVLALGLSPRTSPPSGWTSSATFAQKLWTMLRSAQRDTRWSQLPIGAVIL